MIIFLRKVGFKIEKLYVKVKQIELYYIRNNTDFITSDTLILSKRHHYLNLIILKPY